jgi:hypothetical protein
MRAFAAVNFSKPVIMRGKIMGYSDGSECKHVQNEWMCFFLPMSSSHDDLLKYGKPIDSPSFNLPDEAAVPPIFKELGFVFWWGVVQHRMFRVNKVVSEHILEEAQHMDKGRGFPFGFPLTGMHVRHGDKHTDGFIEHSLDEELAAIRKSSECHVRNTRGDCFYALNMSDISTASIIMKAIKRHSYFLRSDRVEQYNFIDIPPSISAVAYSKPHQGHGDSGGAYNLVNSTEAAATFAIGPEGTFIDPKIVWHYYHTYHRQSLHNGNTSFSLASEATNFGPNRSAAIAGSEFISFVLPLRVFVASDDMSVLRSAVMLGHMADTTGISQDNVAATTGMLKTLLAHPELGYNASLEIITDIYFLSHCSTLLGIAASQVFRTSVALANVTGVLKYAVVMDAGQIGKVKMLSNKYRIPFPENFNFARKLSTPIV